MSNLSSNSHRAPEQTRSKTYETVTISLLARQAKTLKSRVKDLSIGRSRVIQILLDIEARDCLLRPEVAERLKMANLIQLTNP